MFWMILSAIATVAVFAVVCYFSGGFTPKALLSLLCLLLFVPGCVASVPTGYTGIMTEFGRVLDGTLDAGIYFKAPWRDVVTMDNRTQKVSGQTSAFSADIQQVDAVYSINFSIDKSTAMNLYRNVGVEYFDTVVQPRLTEALKGAVSQYNAEELVSRRESLSKQVTDALAGEMKAYGIHVITVNMEDIDFTDAFTDAVEAKQVAEQRKLQTATEQEQEVLVAKAQAEKARIAAQADADVAKLQSDAALYAAQNEAKANKELAESITDGLIRYLYTERWNGQLPSVQLGENSAVYPVIDIP